MTSHNETSDRFAFGRNWRDFSQRLTPEDYAKARNSLRTLVGDLPGKKFLDIGCGSGLFSIAANSLGARHVVGFDIDADSVSTAQSLVGRIAEWDEQVQPNAIEFRLGSILDIEDDHSTYDVVYSWGVLHHTGRMYEAFEKAASLVGDKGVLAIAIYNKHFTSPIWKAIKFTYVKSPWPIKKLLVWLVFTIKLIAAVLLTWRNPLQRRRGMRYYNDIVDWVGGYPYEYASIDEVVAFFESRGFKSRCVTKTRGFTGCNEFVFERAA
jgi:2-polyprenyl-3-methyl-5-hydroxy-6-metoxy-1,4-benzoquinol methylase